MEASYTPSFYNNENVINYVKNAFGQANGILNDQYIVHRRERTYGTSWCFVSSRGGNARNNNRAAVFALGTIACTVGAFLLGVFLTNREDAQDKLQDIRDFKKITMKPLSKELRDNGINSPDFIMVERVVKLHKGIFKHRLQNANLNISLAVSAIAFGIIGIVGALIASQALMVSAVVGIVVVGAITAFKVGYAHLSRIEKENAKKIQDLAPVILNMEAVVY